MQANVLTSDCGYNCFRFVPPNSIIAMDDFDGPEALATHLKYLMKNPDEYMKYFKWREDGWALASWNLVGRQKAGVFVH